MAETGVHSPYVGMTAEEVVRSYNRSILTMRVTHIILALACGAVAIYAVHCDLEPLYVVGLVLLALDFVVFCIRLGRSFLPLQDILWQDADVAKYRAVMEARALKVRNRRSGANLIELELAFCDYYDGRDRDALTRLDRVSFRGERNFQWVRAYNLRAMICNDLGKIADRDAAVARLSQMHERYRAGSKAERQLVNLLQSMEVRFRPVSEWSESDVRFIREQLVLTEKHLNRAGFQLRLAAWELAQGNTEAARRELTASSLEPLAPRQAAERELLLKQC